MTRTYHRTAANCNHRRSVTRKHKQSERREHVQYIVPIVVEDDMKKAWKKNQQESLERPSDYNKQNTHTHTTTTELVFFCFVFFFVSFLLFFVVFRVCTTPSISSNGWMMSKIEEREITRWGPLNVSAPDR